MTVQDMRAVADSLGCVLVQRTTLYEAAIARRQNPNVGDHRFAGSRLGHAALQQGVELYAGTGNAPEPPELIGPGAVRYET
jgi:hypothetical protein